MVKVININTFDKYGIKNDIKKTTISEFVYIGRPSILENPYPIGEINREESIKKYKDFIIERIKERDEFFLNELYRLKHISLTSDLYLECYCKPKKCHGDFIKKILDYWNVYIQ